MPKLALSYRDVTRAYEGKLRLDFRRGAERNAWYIIEGKKTHRLTLPHQHRGTIPPKTLTQMLNQSKLSTSDFAALVKCPMTGADYEAKIRMMIKEGLM